MMSKVDWKTNEKLAVGKGATVQEFFATVGSNKLQIDVAPWGEGHLKVNGREIAKSTTLKIDAKPSASSIRWPFVISWDNHSNPTVRESHP